MAQKMTMLVNAPCAPEKTVGKPLLVGVDSFDGGVVEISLLPACLPTPLSVTESVNSPGVSWSARAAT